MNKRYLHHLLAKLRRVSYWYFLVACIIFGASAVIALRQNNLNAIKLRDQVLATDQQNGDTETALKNLRVYVYSHMNTSLATSSTIYPPIQLKYRYERLVATEKTRVANINGNLYNDAQKYCEQNFPQSFIGAGRLPCIQNYLDSHPNAKEQAVPDSLYKFDFASPVWSPDLAGWSLVAFGLFAFLFMVRFVLEQWLRHELKNHL